RKQIGKRKGLVEKKMFGGLAFLLKGNMSVGVHGNELIVRIAPDQTDAALAKPDTRIFDITGKPMKGWILVKPAGLKNDTALAKWVRVGVEYAASLLKK
ncbi:MAG: TfoX/Sxy family protein, partial [Bacteroidota bacterium]